MRREGSTPIEYIAGLEGWQLEKVEALRCLIQESAPKAKETVRGGILYYEDDGDLFALAAQKHHVALYVLAPSAMADNQAVLENIDHGKGCIRFRKTTLIPSVGLKTLLSQAATSDERECRS